MGGRDTGGSDIQHGAYEGDEDGDLVEGEPRIMKNAQQTGGR